MKQKQTFKQKARNLVAGGLIGITGFLSGCGSNGKLVDSETLAHPYVQTAFVSDYVGKHGVAVKGQVRQDLVNVNVNDRLSGFVWQNYSYDENDFNERDFGLTYTLPINDKLSISGGYQYWDYPSGTFGDHDEVLKAGVHYSGKLDLDYDLTQLLPQENTESGTRHYFKVSKTFPIGEIAGAKISVKPSLSMAYIDNYHGNSGLSQVTPGVNLGIQKGKLGINLFVEKQFSQNPQIEDLTWSGIRVGWTF